MQPEKIFVFGPLVIFFLIMISLILGFLVVVGKLVLKGKRMAWKGVLIDKIYRTQERFDDHNRVDHFYTLIFKTEDGKTIKIGTSREIYDTYQIGDKAEKKSGDFWPEKTT